MDKKNFGLLKEEIEKLSLSEYIDLFDEIKPSMTEDQIELVIDWLALVDALLVDQCLMIVDVIKIVDDVIKEMAEEAMFGEDNEKETMW